MRTHCAHCGFEHVDAAAKFCSRCGALVHVSQASTWSIFTDWSEHYIGSHGALWRTLKQLFFSPGALTQSYFDGARGATLKPIQLYLLASLFTFFFLNLGGGGNEASTLQEKPSSTVSLSNTRATIELGSGDDKEFQLTLKHVEDWFAKQSFFGSKGIQQHVGELRAMSGDQRMREFNKGKKRYAPIIGFLLVPFLAVFTKLFWKPSMRFAEHVVFALHLQTVVLLLVALLLGINFLSLPDWVGGAVFAAILVWAWYAFRRVFRRSALGTSLGLLVSIPLYLIAVGLAGGTVIALAILVG